MQPPIDQTVGLLGAGAALLTAGALVVLGERVDVTNAVLVPLVYWVYPVAALLGFDLATRGGPLAGEGALAQAGSYFTAVAAAHLEVAAGVIAGVAFGISPRGTATTTTACWPARSSRQHWAGSLAPASS